MLGLPSKPDNKKSVVVATNGDKDSVHTISGRRQSTHNILVLTPTMMGSQMVMLPLPKDGRGLDWPPSMAPRD